MPLRSPDERRNPGTEVVDRGAPHIGQRLKANRKAQRRTLNEVAQASGVTRGYLSKIERDLASASVAALLRICSALDISLSALFENNSTGRIVRRDNYPSINFGGHDLAEYLLTAPTERRVQVLLSEIRPGGGSGNEPYSLPAEVEFVYVLSGELELGFPDQTVRLCPGDAFTFDAATAHTFRAHSLDQLTSVLWVICPALSAGVRTEGTEPQDASG